MSLMNDEVFQKYAGYHLEELKKKEVPRILEALHERGVPRRLERERILASEEYRVRLKAALEGDPYVGCFARGEEPTGKLLEDFLRDEDLLRAICGQSPDIRPEKLLEKLEEAKTERWWASFGEAGALLLDALSDGTAEARLQEITEGMMEEFLQVYSQVLRTEEQTLMDGRYLTEDTLDDFLVEVVIGPESSFEYIPGLTSDKQFIAKSLGGRDFEDLALSRLFASYGITLSEEQIRDLAVETVRKQLDSLLCESDYFEIIDEKADAFDCDAVCAVLKENPHYTDLFPSEEEKQRREEEAMAAILTAIPASCPALYPLARRLRRRFVVHVGETNSGKTHDAIEALGAAGEGIYLGPLRLLAFEQYERLNREGFPCSMVTGEEERLVKGARIQASTIEMLPLEKRFSLAVIDEAQMCGDEARGWAWTAAILGVQADVVHVCTAPEGKDVILRLISECGDSCEVVPHERKTPLIEEEEPFSFPEDVRPGDALIVFSRKKVHAVAGTLQKKGISCSVIYGSLPYDVRHRQAADFSSGKTQVVVATDAIGMGMNLPIRRVVLLELSKYDGREQRILTGQELRQIAGRAGRYGIHEAGLYTCLGDRRTLHKVMRKKVPPVEKAYIGFPGSLMYLGEKLSETIRRWNTAPVGQGYEHADAANQIALAKSAEELTRDRSLVYAFSRLPVENRDGALSMMWKEMLKAQIDGVPYEAPDWVTARVQKTRWDDEEELLHLEEWHRACDLLYCYGTRFEPGRFSWASQKKDEISSLILAILQKQKLSPKRCRNCGRTLPWNYPFGLCEGCHDELYGYIDYYDDDDDEDEDFDPEDNFDGVRHFHAH